MIIEYLCQKLTGAGEERPQFTVNTAVFKAVLTKQVGTDGYLRNAAGYRYFAPDDNIRLLSLGIVFPYQFTIATRGVRLDAFAMNDVGGGYGIRELTGTTSLTGSVELPYDGAEFPLDVTISHKSTGKPEGYIFNPVAVGVPDQAPYVSMINAPTALNGVTLMSWVFSKVIHTLPMVAG